MLEANYRALCDRQPGVLFGVDRQGRLAPLSLGERVRYHFDRHYRTGLQARVRAAVTYVVKSKVQWAEIAPLTRLSPKIFDRRTIHPHILRTRFPQLFSENLTLPTPEGVARDAALFEQQQRTAELALALGMRPHRRGESATDPYFLVDLHDRVIGVFKSNDPVEIRGWVAWIKSWFNTVFISNYTARFFLNPENECRGEVAASRISERFLLHNVPLTREVTFTIDGLEKRGSMQLFILGNIDRHFCNWLISDAGRIWAIDNGRSFLCHHSETILSRHNAYLWRLLPQTRQPFSEAGVRMIHYLSDGQETLFDELVDQGLINREQARCARERIAVLIHYARTRRTLFDLAHVRSAAEVQAALPRTEWIELGA